jgi:hypothetical protein
VFWFSLNAQKFAGRLKRTLPLAGRFMEEGKVTVASRERDDPRDITEVMWITAANLVKAAVMPHKIY